MTRKQFAVVKPFDGEIVGLIWADGTEQLAGDGRVYRELAEPLAAFPDPPSPAAVWSWGDTGPYWHDPRPLEQVKAARWTELKAQRQALDEAPIPVQGFAIDADLQSRTDVMGAILAMQLNGQTSRLWRCSDNVMRELSFADIVAAGTAIAARRQSLIETSDQLYQQIQDAEDAAAVEGVVWPTP